MANFPTSYKEVPTYGNLAWDATEGAYYYDETIRHYCTEVAVADYETFYQNTIAAEQSRDSRIIINDAQSELNWAAAGRATRV